MRAAVQVVRTRHASGWPPPVRDSSGLCSVWSVCALSIGKARAAVPACAVVAGGQCGPPCGGLAGLGANLARRGRFRGRWRRCRLRLVVYLGRVPWRALAARLRALWLGGCLAVCPCPLRGPCGRRVAGAGVVLIGCAWSLPPLRFGPLQPPPLRLLVHLSSAPAVWRPLAGRGGVALVAWSDCQRTCAAGVAGVAACVVAVAGVEPAAPLWRAPMVTAVALAGR